MNEVDARPSLKLVEKSDPQPSGVVVAHQGKAISLEDGQTRALLERLMRALLADLTEAAKEAPPNVRIEAGVVLVARDQRIVEREAYIQPARRYGFAPPKKT